MDFAFTEEQDAVRELAARILGDLSTPERLKEVEATEDRIDRKLWAELGSAGLLGVALPESCGGAGLGFLAACIVAEEVGRHAAAVPFVASVVLGAGPIAQFGSEEQQRRWLPGAVSGDDHPDRGAGRAGRRSLEADARCHPGRRRLAPRRDEGRGPGGHDRRRRRRLGPDRGRGRGALRGRPVVRRGGS